MMIFLWIIGLISILVQQAAPVITAENIADLTGETLLQSPFPVHSLAIHPDSTQLAYGGESNLIYAVELDTMEAEIYNSYQATVFDLAFSADGSLLTSGGANGTVMVWQYADGELLQRFEHSNFGSVNSVAISPESALVASAGYLGLFLWSLNPPDPRFGEAVQLFDASYVGAVTFHPNGELVAGMRTTESLLYNLAGVDTIPPPRSGPGIGGGGGCGGRGPADAMAFNNDGTILVMTRCQSFSYGFEPDYTSETRINANAAINAVSFNPVNNLLVTASADGSIQFWQMTDTNEFELSHTLDAAHENEITALVFLPNGTGLLSADLDGMIKLWRIVL